MNLVYYLGNDGTLKSQIFDICDQGFQENTEVFWPSTVVWMVTNQYMMTLSNSPTLDQDDVLTFSWCWKMKYSCLKKVGMGLLTANVIWSFDMKWPKTLTLVFSLLLIGKVFWPQVLVMLTVDHQGTLTSSFCHTHSWSSSSSDLNLSFVLIIKIFWPEGLVCCCPGRYSATTLSHLIITVQESNKGTNIMKYQLSSYSPSGNSGLELTPSDLCLL